MCSISISAAEKKVFSPHALLDALVQLGPIK